MIINSSLNRIVCVAEGNWVQHNRIKYFKTKISNINWSIISQKKFIRLYNKNLLENSHIYFPTWRTPYSLQKTRQCVFNDSFFKRSMSSVTSHYNIGGGLNPSKAIPIGESEDSYFNDAIDFLKQFKVVSANSMILYNQLKPFLSNIMYAPNGVDENFFKPSKINKYDNNNLTIGWVGKIKAAKNYETAKKSFVQLRKEGFKISEIALKKNVSKIRIKSPKKMKKYYQKIDYFLCSSWHEGTPNPALEAGASGVPIITTKVGNMPDLIKHNINGFFIEPNVESIVKQFNKLKNIHTDRYNELSKNIRLSILNDWTWEKKILRHDLTFKALLGNE